MKHNIFMSYLVGLCFMVIFHFCILLFSFRKVFMMWRNEKGAKQTIHQKNMNGKNIDDKLIIQEMRRSAGEGLRLLMAKYREPVYWHIRRLVVSHEDAQDAAQETFVRIYQSFSQIKSDKSFRSWMFRIATNEALRLIGARPQHEASLEADASQANHLMAQVIMSTTTTLRRCDCRRPSSVCPPSNNSRSTCATMTSSATTR